MLRVDVNANEAEIGPVARARAWIENPGPYQFLLLLAGPICPVEPMKLAAIAKPKLTTLPWFTSICTRFVALRATVMRWIGWERVRPMEQSHERLL